MKLTGSFQIATVAMVMTLSACSGDSTVLEELADSVASAPAPEVVSSPDVSPLPETEVTPSPESQTNQGIQSAADIEISPLPEQDQSLRLCQSWLLNQWLLPNLSQWLSLTHSSSRSRFRSQNCSQNGR